MTPAKPVESFIVTLRGQKVILDADLAELYAVTTKRLNEQVKRNADRFPPDFMFQISTREWVAFSQGIELVEYEDSRSQIATLNPQRAQMDAKLPEHDEAVRVIWQELQPLLKPLPEPPQKVIGLHVKEKRARYGRKSM